MAVPVLGPGEGEAAPETLMVLDPCTLTDEEPVEVCAPWLPELWRRLAAAERHGWGTAWATTSFVR